jgi:hypothetical protein
MLGPRASEVQDDDAVEQFEQAGRAVVDGAREGDHDHLLLLPAPPWYKTTQRISFCPVNTRANAAHSCCWQRSHYMTRNIIAE